MFIIAVPVSRKPGHDFAGPSASESRKATMKMVTGAVVSLEARVGTDPLPSSHSCWQKLVPCDWKTWSLWLEIALGSWIALLYGIHQHDYSHLQSQQGEREKLQPEE